MIQFYFAAARARLRPERLSPHLARLAAMGRSKLCGKFNLLCARVPEAVQPVSR